MKKLLILIIIILVVVIGYSLIKKPNNQINTNSDTEVQNNKNWEEYKSEEYGFSIKYPQDYKINQPGSPEEYLTIKNPEEGTYDTFYINIASTEKSNQENSVFNVRSVGDNDKLYDIENNRWLILPEREVKCFDTELIGQNELASYPFTISDAGFYLEKNILITDQYTYSINLDISPTNNRADPHMEEIIDTFKLINDQQAITARCN